MDTSKARQKRRQTHLFSVEYMTAEAIAFLRAHEPEEGYFVGFSGGKDSIVTRPAQLRMVGT